MTTVDRPTATRRKQNVGGVWLREYSRAVRLANELLSKAQKTYLARIEDKEKLFCSKYERSVMDLQREKDILRRRTSKFDDDLFNRGLQRPLDEAYQIKGITAAENFPGRRALRRPVDGSYIFYCNLNGRNNQSKKSFQINQSKKSFQINQSRSSFQTDFTKNSLESPRAPGRDNGIIFSISSSKQLVPAPLKLINSSYVTACPPKRRIKGPRTYKQLRETFWPLFEAPPSVRSVRAASATAEVVF